MGVDDSLSTQDSKCKAEFTKTQLKIRKLGIFTQLTEGLANLYRSPGFLALALHQTRYESIQICNPSTAEVEAGGSNAQGFPQLHIEFKAILGYLRPCCKNRG